MQIYKLSILTLISLLSCTVGSSQDAGKEEKKIESLHCTFGLRVDIEKQDEVSKKSPMFIWLPIPQVLKCQGRQGLSLTRSWQGSDGEQRSEKLIPLKHYRIVKDNHSNEVVEMSITRADFPQSIAVTAAVTRQTLESSSFETVLSAKQYLSSNLLVPIDLETKIRAQQIVGESSERAEQIEKLFNATLAHMSYDKSGKGWGMGSLKHACEVGKGNCTDFHAFFIGHSRSLKLAARFEIGMSVDLSKLSKVDVGEKLKLSGYHCWAFAENSKLWFPLDISEAWKHPKFAKSYFGRLPADRITLSTGRDIRLSSNHQSKVLNYFVRPYAEHLGKVVSTKTELWVSPKPAANNNEK